MSIVKERILGAVTVMSEEDAEEIAAINAYKAGVEEYQPFCPQENLLKELES